MPKQIKVALIDAHALIHRAFHALPPMKTRAGVPTNAVYGFTAMLLKVLTVIKPTHVVAAFDMKGPTFRHLEYADYKAHRPKAAPELAVQFDMVRDLVRAFSIPIIEKQSFEADDIIGTLVKKLGKKAKKIIVTGDMDALQLVDEQTSVFTLKKGVTDTISYTPQAVHEKYGFIPALVPDYKGLRGDPSDNIPGVAGIGEKTAKELVSKYGPLEKIFEHIDELPTRVQTRLRGQEKEAYRSRSLATIKCDVEFIFDLEAARLDDYDIGEVQSLFSKLEFKNFAQRLPKSSRTPGQQLVLGKTTVVSTEPITELPLNRHVIEGAAAEQQLRQELAKEKIVAFDTETDRLGARDYPIVGMSFAVPRGTEIHAWYVPATPESVKAWKGFFEDTTIAKVGHNIKYDVAVLAQSGIAVAPVTFDTMIASYLLSPDARQHNMDYLAFEELQHETIPITSLIGTGKDQGNMSDVPLLPIANYAAEDAEITWRLYQVFAPRITQEGLTRVFSEIEMPLIPVLARMERAGVRLDTAQLVAMSKKVLKRINILKRKIWELAGEEFNVNSTQQLRRILYEKLLIATDKVARTQTGFSTAAAELEKLREAHPIIALLEEYRELTKLQSTYIETLPHLVNRTTKRVHTSYNQVVAATGRLSSQDPNLQNIPVRTELGQEIRAAFVADKGRVLVKADYSQLELRLAAHISQDEKMIAAFRAGEDIHRATAAWVHGVPLKQVTDAQRRQAKTLNFGVLYGMGPKKFAQTAGLSIEEARSFIARYQQQYAGVTKLVAATIEQARTLGYVETLFGRRRYLPEIQAQSPMIRAQAERVAFNFPIQGTEADILKKAMIELDQYLADTFDQAQLILSVHDELVCEVLEKDATAVARAMQKIMAGVITLDVPLTVDVAVGKNWRDTVPLR